MPEYSAHDTSRHDNAQSLLLERVSRVLSAKIGLYFPPDRHRDLLRGLGKAAPELGFSDLEACLQSLAADTLSRGQIEVLARHLTIGETYFFRDERSFVALRENVLRPLVYERTGKNQTLRLWSAACSSGEEPYSLAMLLREMLPRVDDWRITLIATDLNSRALARARQAEYSEWSFRALPAALREKYFDAKAANRFVLRDAVRKMVRFEYLNLVEDAFPSPITDTQAMDVILCRNVLMYFESDVAQAVIHKMYRALADGGYLLTSANEGPKIDYRPFTLQHFSGAIAYRKIESAAHAKSTLQTPFQSTRAANGASISKSIIAKPTTNRATRAPLISSAAPKKSASSGDQSNNDLDAARRFFEAGEYSPAAALLEELLRAPGPHKRDAAELLARCYANENKLDAARRWCEVALAEDKLQPRLYLLRATILQEQGEMEGAAAALRQALYLDHDFIAAQIALGNLLRAQNQMLPARRHFANAQQLLQRLAPEMVLPEIEGMTAGRLLEWVERMAKD